MPHRRTAVMAVASGNGSAVVHMLVLLLLLLLVVVVMMVLLLVLRVGVAITCAWTAVSSTTCETIITAGHDMAVVYGFPGL